MSYPSASPQNVTSWHTIEDFPSLAEAERPDQSISTTEAARVLGIPASTLRKKLAAASRQQGSSWVRLAIGEQVLSAHRVRMGRRVRWSIELIPPDAIARAEEGVRTLRSLLAAPEGGQGRKRGWWRFGR